MTLQQLRYVTAVADTGTISKAAQKFYISQPSLTNSIHELEQELGLTIFHRTNRGTVLTPEGNVFLGYARQVLAQVELIEEKYLGTAPVRHQFCVSAQHYSFAVEAFVQLLKEYGGTATREIGAGFTFSTVSAPMTAPASTSGNGSAGKSADALSALVPAGEYGTSGSHPPGVPKDTTATVPPFPEEPPC